MEHADVANGQVRQSKTLDDAALHRLRNHDPFWLGHSLHNAITSTAYESIRQGPGCCLGECPELLWNIPAWTLCTVLTCVAFAAPYSVPESCPVCGEGSGTYDTISLRTSGQRSRVARQKFATIPLQALWCDPQHAEGPSTARGNTADSCERLNTEQGAPVY
ncbi:hypothetical protein SCLCIDRAFT_279236 [Scleroderma citrinum Foug A]|uniref:Uncharacterized protein n=1 Tax=Scleroderma citrinum Foug A TaxID=1036808 RepID=A0A0C2Z290_9AGAM|nr:hypothetical protein SCLCIDRAFT_279236 [Scleroderma citrinum Foug A]